MTEVTDMVKRLSNLSDLTFGYPCRFSVGHLLDLIRKGRNLQRLIIIFNQNEKKKNPVHRNDAVKFQNIVNIVQKRPHKKLLNIIIVGNENQIKPFKIALPTEVALKITCLLAETVKSISNAEKETKIGKSNEEIEVIRRQALLE